MNEIKITIEGLNELMAALQQLCAITGSACAPGLQAPLQAIETPPAQQNIPVMTQPVAPPPLLQAMPTQAPLQQQQRVPIQQSMPVQSPVPTQVPTTAVPQKFTQDMLAVAAAGLVNQGKQARLIEILHGFGVNTLIELPEAQYGAFAGALRMEGAVING